MKHQLELTIWPCSDDEYDQILKIQESVNKIPQSVCRTDKSMREFQQSVKITVSTNDTELYKQITGTFIAFQPKGGQA